MDCSAIQRAKCRDETAARLFIRKYVKYWENYIGFCEKKLLKLYKILEIYLVF